MIDQIETLGVKKRDRGDYFKRYHAENRDLIRARKRAHYAVHGCKDKDAQAANAKAWYERNKAEVIAYRKQRRLENLEQAKRIERLGRRKRREEERERHRAYYVANKEKCDAATKSWFDRNKEAVHARQKSYREENADKLKQLRRRYRQANKEKLLAKQRKYRAEHPEVFRKSLRKYFAKKRATPRGALDHRMSTSVWQALRGAKAGRKWETLVGYTVDDLYRHIENRFTSGMSWAELLAGKIEIDHVIPKVKFTYSTAEDRQFRQCWALENLQPKWAPDNIRKKDKLEKHEQIPLGI